MATLEYIGTEYSGRYVPVGVIREGITMFSFGVGEDISFEAECAKRGCKCVLFDPTPRSIKYMRQFDFEFHPIGISHYNGFAKFYYPKDPTHVSCSMVNLQETDEYFMGEVRTWKQIVKQFGMPSLLKLDIEGEECNILPKMKDFPECLIVEFHGQCDEYISHLTRKYGQSFKNGQDYLFI